MSRKRLIILSPVIAAAAVILATVLPQTSDSKNTSAASQNEDTAPRSLNDTLCNAMSAVPATEDMDRMIRKYLDQWEIKGASLAIMRNDSLLYAKGYGYADEEKDEEMTPGHILRVASVSKLITAAGIVVLKERGLLSLQDTVFGEKGILCDSVYTAAIREKSKFGITVEQLLRHQAGFTNSRGDPMFSTRDIIRQFRLPGPPDHETLVRCVLTRPLGYQPGSWQRYSNFGYLLLSMIIEKVSGCGYEEFIKENVLEPAGCYDMHIANNYYEEKYPNEARYYMQSGSEPCEEYNLSGRMVERCYGGNDIHGLSGAGAWCGSAAELSRFVAAVDGKPEVPDIISRESVDEMTEYFDSETFSLGWNDTKPTGEWTRTGTLGGTSALVKYFPDGECWTMITNTSTWKGPGFTKNTESLFRKCRELYGKDLPAQDLFRLNQPE